VITDEIFMDLDTALNVMGEYGVRHAQLRRLIHVASKLDVRSIRTFTFWRRVEYTEQIEDRIVDAYREPARIAQEVLRGNRPRGCRNRRAHRLRRR
jgi:hypothetical protein